MKNNGLLLLIALSIGTWWVISKSKDTSAATQLYATSFEALNHVTKSKPYVAWSSNGWYITDVKGED